MKIFIQLMIFFLPWPARRAVLQALFGFELHKTSRIGYSIILARKLVLDEYARIGSFNLCKSIDYMRLGKYSNIGNFNYITGFSVEHPAVKQHQHFSANLNRKCEFIVGSHTGITSRHYFDCNGGIYIGSFSQVAGLNSVFMTHGIDLRMNRQDARPIIIGDYCFVSSSCTILKDCRISDKVTIGACSLVNRSLIESNAMYAGIPARLKLVNVNYNFYTRKEGFVK